MYHANRLNLTLMIKKQTKTWILKAGENRSGKERTTIGKKGAYCEAIDKGGNTENGGKCIECNGTSESPIGTGQIENRTKTEVRKFFNFRKTTILLETQLWIVTKTQPITVVNIFEHSDLIGQIQFQPIKSIFICL